MNWRHLLDPRLRNISHKRRITARGRIILFTPFLADFL